LTAEFAMRGQFPPTHLRGKPPKAEGPDCVDTSINSIVMTLLIPVAAADQAYADPTARDNRARRRRRHSKSAVDRSVPD